MKHKIIDTARACFLVEIAEKVYKADPLNPTRAISNLNARSAISVVLIQERERYEAIGSFLNKDHSSIHHNVKKHPDLMKFDKEYRSLFQLFLLEIAKPRNQQEYTLNEIQGSVKKCNIELAELGYSDGMILDFWEGVLEEHRANKLLRKCV